MTTEIDKDLVATLKQAKAGRPMQFAFLGKGTGGTLLAAKKLLPADIAEAKKKEGGTLVRGRLVGGDGALVFEVAKEPPANLAGQLKRSIKEHAGLTWEVEVRVKGDAEEDGAPDEPAAEGRAAPPVGREQVLARLQRLKPGVKAALAGPNAARVQTLLGAVNGLFKNNDFAQAGKVLDELEPLVGAGAAPPPPPPPPPAPPPPDPAKAAVLKRLRGLTGAIKAALAGPNAARVQSLAVAVNGLAKNNDFAQAGKVLDELEPLLTQGPAPAPPAPPPPPGGGTKADVVKRLNGLAAALKAALAGPDGARLKALSVAVNGFVKNNDFVQAAKVLDEVEPLLAAPAAPPVFSLVRLQQCRLAWDAAVKKVQGGLDKLGQATRQVYAGDPRLGQIEAAIDMIVANLRGHYEDLSDKLDEALNAEAPDERQQRHREARARVQQFLAYMDSDPVLQQIDDNGLVSLEIKKTLSAVLPVLASKLGA